MAGSTPGSLYYSYVPATQTYWATADYTPVKGVPLAVTVSFQDGGETYRAAIERTAKHFGYSERHVEKCVADWNKHRNG